MKNHEHWFNRFAAKKILEAGNDIAPLELKQHHTMNVLRTAMTITRDEALSSPLARLCHLAALYHDLGRFDQYLRYGTFKDRESVNHGLLAVKILKKEKRLEEETSEARHAVLAAVGLHNRSRLPAALAGDALTACQVVRDADKLDILRVMDEHLTGKTVYNPTVVLGLPDDGKLHSPRVAASALAGKVASYEDLKSVNDFRLLLGSWFFDLNFGTSRRIFAAAGNARRLVEALPDDAIYGKAKKHVLDMLEKEEKLNA